MNKLLSILLFISISLFAYTQQNCQTPFYLGATVGTCNTVSKNFNREQSSIWLKFIAPNDSVSLQFQSSTDSIFKVYLRDTNCNSLPIQEIVINSMQDSVVFSQLQTYSAYVIEIERLNNTNVGSINICISTKAENVFWTNEFTDSNGNQLLHCKTEMEINGHHGNVNCNELTVCINETLNLAIVAPYQLYSPPFNAIFPHYIQFLTQNGAVINPISSSSNSTLSTQLSFTNTGTVTFFLIPELFLSNTQAYLGMINNPNDFAFTIHVVNNEPPAVLTDEIICIGESTTLQASPGAIMSNISIDGTPINGTYTSLSINSLNLGVGVHTVNYTITGDCGTSNYSATITVIDNNDLQVTIDNCGNATFTFYACKPFTSVNVIMDFGDGTTTTGVMQNTNTITFTHHYTSLSPIQWTFNIPYPMNPASSIFIQTGTFQGVSIYPITINAASYLCEMGTSVYFSSTQTLNNINWSLSPNLSFTGQGTNTIDIVPGIATNNDLHIIVTGEDVNGCLYQGNVVIKGCCTPPNVKILPAVEYFENTYYSHTDPVLGMANKIPPGFFFAPTNVAINISQNATGVISTPYSTPITLSSLIASNGLPNSGVLNLPNTALFLNNDLIIDQDIIIVNCPFIRLAPNARIILNSNVSVKIFNATFAPKCDEMWGGFLISQPGCTFSSRSANFIGAKSAVTATLPFTYDFQGSVFIDNFVGISLSNIPNAAGSFIQGNYFGDVVNKTLLYPYNYQNEPDAGIVLNNVKGFTVGAISTFDFNTNGNLFHNLRRGIDGYKSSITSNKNAFFQMQHTPGTPAPNEGDKYCGIRTNGSSIKLVNALNVGTSVLNKNYFVSCDYGVSSNNGMNTYIKYSYMNRIRLRGISAESNMWKLLDIQNNQINQQNPNAYGIYIKNSMQSTVVVKNNQLNNSAVGQLGNAATKSAAGIYISSYAPNVQQTTTVENNTIRNALYGIWLLNVPNATLNKNTINIDFMPNEINNLTSVYAPIRGILAQNSSKANIWNNTVTRNNGTATQVTTTQIQGIRIEMCPSAYIFNNTMTRTAVGFYALGSSLGARVECNKMQQTYNGFYMDAADISDQGSATHGANNKWIGTLQARTDGTLINHGNAAPLNYYHNNINIFYSDPSFIIGSPQYKWTDISITTNIDHCPYVLAPPVISLSLHQLRQRSMGAVVSGGAIYDSLDSQMKHYLNQFTLSSLKHDPNLENLGTADDVHYQQYDVAMQNSNTATLLNMQNAFSTEDFDTASLYIAQLPSADSLLQWNKTVATIWTQSKLQDSVIAVTDSLTLHNIACMDPLSTGSAVYFARAILDWNGCEQQPALQARGNNSMPSENTETAMNTSIYPNPSSGSFSIQSNKEMNAIAIHNLSGKLLHNATIKGIDYKYNSTLDRGVYIATITFEDGTNETHKIVVE